MEHNRQIAVLFATAVRNSGRPGFNPFTLAMSAASCPPAFSLARRRCIWSTLALLRNLRLKYV
ncbi:hypothetical protein DAEQUDRAFT_420404 [Daedalea quercina L-15889]|uniref:Uncharacterized protein n=1 Tax=Daedalea quercina L-15889 TaxID=1314783 RepID=A0A165TKZ7_9APHY|nr:hypothetical protein DAEQUDRAFT_420404 [Daedalea quercina L-15889]